MIDLAPLPPSPSAPPTDVAPVATEIVTRPEPGLAPLPPSSSAPPTDVAPVATEEIVTRPEPGLARGKWEAPAWAFWGILAAVVVSATVYALYRLGFLRLGYGKQPESPPRGTRRP